MAGVARLIGRMAAMVAEPVTTLAPALPRPHVLRQRWCDVAFLHWAVRPNAVAWFFPPRRPALAVPHRRRHLAATFGAPVLATTPRR